MKFDIFNLFVELIPTEWLPASDNLLIRGQAILIISLCALLIVAILFILLSWLLSQDLKMNTVIVAIFYVTFLAWIAHLPRTGNMLLAGSLLVTLLSFTVIFITFHYGVSSPSVTAFLLPIILATLVLSNFIGFLVTIVTVLFIWAMALIELRGWLTPMLPVSRDNLTFKAPLFTVIFTAVFLMIGGWNEYLILNLG